MAGGARKSQEEPGGVRRLPAQASKSAFAWLSARAYKSVLGCQHEQTTMQHSKMQHSEVHATKCNTPILHKRLLMAPHGSSWLLLAPTELLLAPPGLHAAGAHR